jgi:hypothetical protein
MAIRLLSNESIAGNLQFTGSDPTAIYRNSGGIQIKAENIRIKGVTTNENIAAFIENGAVELYYDNSQKFVTTSAGITVTGTTINLDSAASAGYIADRANDTSGATYEYKTGGSLKWYTGLRGVSTEDFYIFNNAQGSTALLLNSSNNFATFAGEVSLKSRLFLQRSSGGATTLIQFRNENGVDKAHIDFGGTNEELGFFAGAGSSEHMTITSTGLVGIGTNNPQSNLHISTSSTNAPIRLQNDNGSGSTANFVLQTDSSGLGNNGFGIYDVANSAYRLVINGSGNVGIGTTSPNAFSNQTSLTINGTNNGRLDLKVGNAQKGAVIASANEMILDAGASPMQFYTGSTLHMLISTSGNVGIGTTSPAYPLEVQSGGVGTVLRAGTSFVSIDSTGSASAPSLILNGDANTGIWRPAADTLAVSTAGSERMRIDSSGNVGIGETSPQRPLHINGTEGVARFTSTASGNNGFEVGIGTSSQAFLWQSENSYMQFATNNTERMRIDSSGNVGIGTTSPLYKVQINAIANGQTALAFMNSAVTADGNGSTNIRFVSATNAQWANASFSAYNFSFFGNGSEKFTILGANGNVGIGNTSPNAPLQFQTIVSTRKIVLFEVGNNDYQFYGFGIEGNTLVYSVGDVGDRHVFFAGSGTGTRNELMRINGNGNVGIGTNSPAHRLQVEDNGNVVRFYNTGSSNATLTLRADGADGTDSAIQVSFRDDGDNAVGSITSTGNGTAFNTSSDYRLKENVVEMTDALDRVSQLKPSRFNFIANPDKTYDGFLAHEVSDLVPEAITGTKDEVDEEGNPIYQEIDQSKLVPLLVGAIQELKAEIEILKNK